MLRAAWLLLALAAGNAFDDGWEYYEGDELTPAMMARNAFALKDCPQGSVTGDIDFQFFTPSGQKVLKTNPDVFPFNEDTWNTVYNMKGPRLPGGVLRHFTKLSFDPPSGAQIDENNLGNMGPNNGVVVGDPTAPAGRHDRNFMSFLNAGKLRDGRTIGIRVDNMTEYRPWDPLNNNYNGAMFQVNLQAIFDVSGVDQSFRVPQFLPDGSENTIYKVLVEDSFNIGLNEIADLDAANTNSVSLFYQFFDLATGYPVEIEETMVGFFDFDQAWADDDKSLVRESIMLVDFDAAMYTNPEVIDLKFSKEYWDKLAGQFGGSDTPIQLILNAQTSANCAVDDCKPSGLLPVQTAVNWPWTESRYDALVRPRGYAPGDWEKETVSNGYVNKKLAPDSWFAPFVFGRDPRKKAAFAGNVDTALSFKRGVIARSKKFGTGPSTSQIPAVPVSCGSLARDELNGRDEKCDTDKKFWYAPRNTPVPINTPVEEVRRQPAYARCLEKCTGPACNLAQYRTTNALGSQFYPLGSTLETGAWQWRGCGMPFNTCPSTPGCSYPTGQATLINTDTGVDEIEKDVVLYPATYSCSMDCPRTSVEYDFGNPVCLFHARKNKQQLDRSFTVVFRDRQNFTVAFRTEIGAAVTQYMMNTAPYDKGGNVAAVKNNIIVDALPDTGVQDWKRPFFKEWASQPGGADAADCWPRSGDGMPCARYPWQNVYRPGVPLNKDAFPSYNGRPALQRSQGGRNFLITGDDYYVAPDPPPPPPDIPMGQYTCFSHKCKLPSDCSITYKDPKVSPCAKQGEEFAYGPKDPPGSCGKCADFQTPESCYNMDPTKGTVLLDLESRISCAFHCYPAGVPFMCQHMSDEQKDRINIVGAAGCTLNPDCECGDYYFESPSTPGALTMCLNSLHTANLALGHQPLDIGPGQCKPSEDIYCSPPSTPPSTTTTTCTACLDPHLSFAHGGRADFKGKHKTWYNMLSARNTSFNALFMHDDFKNMFKLVHGSAMKAATWTLRTNETGRIVTIEFNATTASAFRALVRVSDSAAGAWVHHGSAPFKIENVRVEMRAKRLGGAGKRPWHGTALIVNTGLWSFSVWSKPYPNAAANPGKALLNIQIDPLYDADNDPVAPHGLIGQSWDGDGMATNGLLDDYSASEVTTQAMGEGAIEGSAEQYEIKSKFSTDFAYARFDSKAAKHRDTSKLSTPKYVASASKSAGASADIGASGAGATADIDDDDEDAAQAKSGLFSRLTGSVLELFGRRV